MASHIDISRLADEVTDVAERHYHPDTRHISRHDHDVLIHAAKVLVEYGVLVQALKRTVQ